MMRKMARLVQSGFGAVTVEVLGRFPAKIHGTIKNISHGAVHVNVGTCIEPSDVRVWFSDDCYRSGQLSFCRADARGFCAGIYLEADPSHQQRSEIRVPLANEGAIVTVLENADPGRREAQATDISKSGLGLLVDRTLPQGAWIKVELSFGIAFGDVRYCKEESPGLFRVGLRTETMLMRHASAA
jgi:hypothetical protein